MKLRDFSTWRDEVESYWEDEIDNSDCDNKDTLNDSLYSYMDDLESDYDSYISDMNNSENDTKRILEPLYSYVTIKNKMVILTEDGDEDPDAPNVTELIEDDDLRTLYSYWTYDLPSDYESLFSIDTDETTEECELNTTSTYDNLRDTIQGLSDEDSSELQNFRDNMPGSVRDVMIYKMYKMPPSEMKDIDVRCFVLQDMYFEEVLDAFSYEINGLNINVEECS